MDESMKIVSLGSCLYNSLCKALLCVDVLLETMAE